MAGLLRRDGRRAGRTDNSFSSSMLGGLSAFLWDVPLDLRASEESNPADHLNPTVPPWAGAGFPFPTLDDRWLYITGIGQDQWRRLRDATALPELADPRYAQLDYALGRAGHVQDLIARWVRGLPRDEALARLTDHGVAAWPIRRPAEVLEDERFRESFLYEVEHPTYGPTGFYSAVCPVVAHSDRLAYEDAPAPLLGQHTDHVLREIAGLTDDEIAALHAAGVVRGRE
jgi:crotonobetainyl-CoA:carnitine CoA-transferase CaiB-like acyl-CoA transferase